jgi:Xaa-Pro aminopeptidase
VILAIALFAQITIGEYAARRATVAASMPSDYLLVLGAPEPAEDYLSFEQAPSFMYLTGVNEPEAAVLIFKRGSGVLFVENKDPTQEVWSGQRMGPAGATHATGLPARPRADLEDVLDSLLKDSTSLQVVAPPGDVAALIRAHPHAVVSDGTRLIEQLRGTKSAAELDLLARAAGITSDGERAALSVVAPGVNEYQVQARIEYAFRSEGADRPSFASTVGSGPNATVLHYNIDNRVMRAGDLVVMDVGASYRGYAGDVTRTVPVSGHYSADQRAVYQIVRDAQATAERQALLDAHE